MIMTQRKSMLLMASISALALCIAGLLFFNNRSTLDPHVVDYDASRDKAFIKQLFKDNWSWLVADDNYSVDYMLDNRASSQISGIKGDLTLKIYMVDEKQVGFLAYYKKAFYKGYVLFLAVPESERKKGYAEKLLRYALQHFKNEGLPLVQLITRVDNFRAQGLYKKVGMHEIWRDDRFVRFEIAL